MSNGSFSVPNEYIVFDLETTGLSPAYAEIIEIGAIKVSGGKKVDVFHSYVRPICGIPLKITALTGIKPSDVADAPDAAAVIADFLRFTAGSVLVAHNSPFDCRFISTYSAALGLNFDNDVQDSLKLAKQYIRSPSYKLEVLKDLLGLSFPSHNALDDCKVTAYLVEHCRKLSCV